MVGKRFLLVVGIALAFLVVLSLNHQLSEATTLKVGYQVTVSDSGAGAQSDFTHIMSIPAPHANFSKVITFNSAPEWVVGRGGEVPDGTFVTRLISETKLGLMNGGCWFPMAITFNFLDGTVDTGASLVWDAPMGGMNIVEDNVGTGCTGTSNGLPDYVDCYPTYVADMLDPDGDGPKPPLRPVSRLASHFQVTSGSPPTKLEFIAFAPGDLEALPAPDGDIGPEVGYTNFVILDNPLAESSPSAITDFCTTLATTTDSYALSKGVAGYIASSGTDLEFDTACNHLDTDGDGVIDDGCFMVADTGSSYECSPPYPCPPGTAECNGVNDDPGDDSIVDDGCMIVDWCGDGGPGCDVERHRNPAAGTGIYGTNSHLFGAYVQCYRDTETDGIEGYIDPCAITADPGWDPRASANPGTDGDGDGLPNSCDPVDGTMSPVAPAACPTSGLPDEDQDCYPNRGDNCPLVQNGWETDGALGNQCQNAIDDDHDFVNDGCPTVGGSPETGDECYNRWDDDGDTYVNDGCPKVGAVAETGTAQCGDGTTLNTVSDDGDGVNDGCPQVGSTAESGDECDNNIDDDPGDDGGSPTVNDGCPGLALQQDTDTPPGQSTPDYGHFHDDIGAACEPDWNGDTVIGDVETGDGAETAAALDPNTPDGHYHTDMPIVSACVGGGTDSDGDGWCDATETMLGSKTGDSSSTPEYIGIDYSVVSAPAPGTCSDHDVYGHPDGAKTDNDDDGNSNENESNNDCGDLPDDADDDGVDDLGGDADNCPNDKNPTQTDLDGDTIGDECDDDMDGDGASNAEERHMGTDAYDDCTNTQGATTYPGGDGHAAWGLDIDNSRQITIDDVLFYRGKLFRTVSHSNYTDRRLDQDASFQITIDDVLFYRGKLFASCTSP